MSSLSIGLTGLLVNQRLIDMTGQNVANADNPNYHRQVGELSAGIAGAAIGAGVELTAIGRTIDSMLEDAIVRNASSQNETGVKLTRLNELQAMLAPGEGSLHDALIGFFDAAERLSVQPDDLTQRRVFLYAANDLADRLNSLAENITQISQGLVSQANQAVDAVNALTAQIAELNQHIHNARANGNNANMLLDQRDGAIRKLSELIDIRVVPQEFDQANILSGGTGLVLNATVTTLSAEIDQQNRIVVRAANSTEPIDITGGTLGGMLALANVTMPAIKSQLDDLARSLVTHVDSIQATGLGLRGPMTALSSERTVATPTAPLAVAKLALPMEAGDLYVTVTNLATGGRNLNRISIDPATQSLNDVAAALSTIPNMQAVVDAQAGTLNLIARPGYGFDFTGNVSSQPDAQSITGTATAAIGGAYSGANNDVLHFRFVGSGTIGGTIGLALEVRNNAGALLTSLNVGPGYESGSDLQAVLGVKVKLHAGTVNNGDSFDVRVAAHSDTAGLLPALGLHSFFTGVGAADVRVNRALLDHPEDLALSRSGQPGDGVNLARLITLRDAPTLNGQTLSFQQFLENIIGNVASQAHDAQMRKSAFDSLGEQLQSQQQGVSGVDPNEELMKLVVFQRSYQMSAHFMSVVNQTMDDLLRLVGN